MGANARRIVEAEHVKVAQNDSEAVTQLDGRVGCDALAIDKRARVRLAFQSDLAVRVGDDAVFLENVLAR